MEKPRRGKDGNFCKLFKSSDKNNNRITQSRNRLIEIIKLGHESNHRKERETSEPAISAKASNKKQGNTLQGKHTRNRKREQKLTKP